MKKLVIGFGVSGRSAASFLLKRGESVVAVDKKLSGLIEGVELKRETDLIQIDEFDQVVLSPGIPHTHPLVQLAKKQNIEVIGEVELALRSLNNKMIGITGTNGKTTVTLLVAHVLNHAGICAHALGNIGTPLTSLRDHLTDAVIVAELSSFQLETMNTRALDAAVILNITPDHLDRYPNFEAYAQAKLHIQDCLKKGAPLYMLDNEIKRFGPFLKMGNLLSYDRINFKEIIEYLSSVEYTKKIGHVPENLMAAFCLCQELGVEKQQFLEAFKTFQIPAHRLEFVVCKKDVSYYNDSKGTNIDSVQRAVVSIKGDVVLIAGGVDKGSRYTPWLNVFKDKVIHVFAIGEAAEKIRKDLEPIIPVSLCDTMDSAVSHASILAKPGQNVLLSPGCASFDMFTDYKHRGDEFKRIVIGLGE